MTLIRREWEDAGYGTGHVEVPRWRFIEPQKLLSPQPPDLAEARARQALLLGIDRPELARTAYGEFGQVADSWVHPSFRQYPQVQDAITRYPYDPRRAIALLADLGWRRGADGVLEKEGGQRFALTIRTRDDLREALIIADNWKEIGVVATYENQTPQQLRDREARARYTGIDISRGSMPPLTIIRSLASEQIPTPENRWSGSNRGGYGSQAWDDLGRRYLGSLDEASQVQSERELVRLLTTDLPLMPLMYDPEQVVMGGGLTGVVPITGTSHNGQIPHTWNMHEWDLRPRS
jgi:peptide/nickel transport system substrate-binding protein